MNVPFIPKEDPELPDSYKIVIYYHDGKKEEFEIASHAYRDLIRVYCPEGTFKDTAGSSFKLQPATSPYLEFVTKDDIWNCVPYASIRRWEFDKNFSKIKALNEKRSNPGNGSITEH